MATLNEVLSLSIEGYDPEAFYDGEEQIIKESVIAFCRNRFFLEGNTAIQILDRYRAEFIGWYETFEEMRAENACDVWESDDGYFFRSV